jgi:hypothetical protein
MTSELVVEVGNECLFFRFEGHGTKRRLNDPDYVKTVDLEIKRKDLAFYQNSLLSKMAHNEWNEGCGIDASLPLKSHPMLELDIEWSEGIVDMISHIYKKHSTEHLKLPKGIELDDALVVLEYYCLDVPDPRKIDLSEASVVSRARANIFLKERESVYKAAAYILEVIENHAESETFFLFAKRSHDMRIINEMNTVQFHRVGSRFPVPSSLAYSDLSKDAHFKAKQAECEEFLSWVEKDRMRDMLMSILEDAELVAEFEPTKGDNQYGRVPGSDREKCDDISHVYSRTRSLIPYDKGENRRCGYSFVETEYGQLEELCVLMVTVPQKVKRARTNPSGEWGGLRYDRWGV